MTTIQEYKDISIRGLEANQRVRGVVRGGYVFQGYFYYPLATNLGILKVKAENFTTPFDEDVYSDEYRHLINSRANEG